MKSPLSLNNVATNTIKKSRRKRKKYKLQHAQCTCMYQGFAYNTLKIQTKKAQLLNGVITVLKQVNRLSNLLNQ